MSDEVIDKVVLLEKSLLDLGVQIFHLSKKIDDIKGFREDFFKTLDGLRTILSEKGVINKEDFDAEVDLNKIMKQMGDAFDSIEQPQQFKRKVATH